MTNLDENILIESFMLYYQRIPNLNDNNDRKLIIELSYILRYFGIYLYQSSMEGKYPRYIINEEGELYSELIDRILSKEIDTYNITDRNEEKIQMIESIINNFLNNHYGVSLLDIIKVDMNINTELDENTISDIQLFLDTIKRYAIVNYQMFNDIYQKRRVPVWKRMN